MINTYRFDYEPDKKPQAVVEKGEFIFAAICLEHGHIYAMCSALIEAGATLKYVYDPDFEKVQAFLKAFPECRYASKQEILDDKEVMLIAAAAVTSERCDLGIEVMKSGKDYFTDKGPATTLEQIERAKQTAKETGKKFMCYFSERLHMESAVYASQLIKRGVIGDVIQVLGLGPHKLVPAIRPDWFFEKEKYGGIICDIGSHQIEQYLYFSGAETVRITRSQVGNFAHPEYPELEDFGDCILTGDNGSTGYFRVDWCVPDAFPIWGDARTVILGTKGSIELRKCLDIANDNTADHVYINNEDGALHINVNGRVGYPFFGELILDFINRTENAMTQDYVFKVAELTVLAQTNAEKLV